MKKLTSLQQQLIQQLSDGSCHSGVDLGLKLGISRTAIWKHIKQLIDLNLPIKRLPQKGYCLVQPLILLDEIAIKQHLNTLAFKEIIDIHLFASIDSTNRFLKELPRSKSMDICCAETQTAGRGRFGRTWYSPFGENIYCSSRWHLDCDLSRLSGLSLVVSLAILAAINDLGIRESICVKWPNDILWQGKKLCGNLIEVNAESNSSADIIIGVGLNVNSITKAHPLPDKPWCSLYDVIGKYFDRNLLVAYLIHHLHHYLKKFFSQGFTAFLPQWQKVDYLYNKMITVSQPTGPLHGKAHGVNEMGQLLLVDEKGKTHYLSSGDTSLNSNPAL